MSVICPTVLAETPDDFAAQIARLSGFASRVQIDLMDGIFAPSKSINLNQIYWPQDWTVDLHLMFQKPTEWIEALVSLGPNLVIIHAEADGDLVGMMRHLRKFDIKVGVALLKQTSPESAAKLIEIADHVLLFAGDLGRMGGVADLAVLDKISQVKSINPNCEVGWDGGANLMNIPQLGQGGIDVINVGGAIAKSENPTDAYAKMVAAL